MKNRTNKIFYLMAALAVGGFVSCVEDNLEGVNQSTLITLSPSPVQFAADGKTADGDDAYEGKVTLKQGSVFSAMDFTVEVDKDWADVEVISIESTFKETHSGVEHVSVEPGIKITVDPNTNWRRWVNLTVTAADGVQEVFTFEQLGEKPDATLELSSSTLEFASEGQTLPLDYTTNMADIAFEIEYKGDATGWLKVEKASEGKINVTASAWTEREYRTAILTVVAGTAETSEAKKTVEVTQLAAKDYYYLYGSSVGNRAEADAVVMDEVTEEVAYSARTYFMTDPQTTKNVITLRKNLSDQYYSLKSDGTIVALTDKNQPQDGPTIDIDGMRFISINLREMTWEWERITTRNCLPDDKVSEYKTKEYVTRDGSTKTWMVEHMKWDGGDINPKLGSGMYKIATGGKSGSGGYTADAFPTSWDDKTKLNMKLESKEMGGDLAVTSEYGRLYTYHEVMTGTPRFGIGYARYETAPDGWKPGDIYTDAIGKTYNMVAYTLGANNNFTDDSAEDENNFPILTIQAQGICPYGYHVANASDWLDLFYAMADASEKNGESKFPVKKSDITYKKFAGTDYDGNTSIPNISAWLRNSTWSNEFDNAYNADGSDDFGFNYYPLGWRYMTEGYQWYGVRMQTWIPIVCKDTQAARLNVVAGQGGNGKKISTFMANLDIGQAVLGFRCVKNYYE